MLHQLSMSQPTTEPVQPIYRSNHTRLVTISAYASESSVDFDIRMHRLAEILHLIGSDQIELIPAIQHFTPTMNICFTDHATKQGSELSMNV
jgi:hypothetical protein